MVLAGGEGLNKASNFCGEKYSVFVVEHWTMNTFMNIIPQRPYLPLPFIRGYHTNLELGAGEVLLLKRESGNSVDTSAVAVWKVKVQIQSCEHKLGRVGIMLKPQPQENSLLFLSSVETHRPHPVANIVFMLKVHVQQCEYKVCAYITEIVRQGMYSTEWSGYIVDPPCQESAHLRVVIFGRGTDECSEGPDSSHNQTQTLHT